MRTRIRHHRIYLYPHAFTNLPQGDFQFITPIPAPLARYPRKHAPQPRKIHLIAIAQTPTIKVSPLASWHQ